MADWMDRSTAGGAETVATGVDRSAMIAAMALDPHAILARLSVEQKVALLAGVDTWHTLVSPGPVDAV